MRKLVIYSRKTLYNIGSRLYRLANDKRYNLFGIFVSDKGKNYDSDPRGQGYQTLYGPNRLECLSVAGLSSLVNCARLPSTVDLWPYLKMLGRVGLACLQQMFLLIGHLSRGEEIYDTGTKGQRYQTFL